MNSCLSGEPLSLVKSLSLTSANYLIARDTLIERYKNSRLIISSHINNIVDLPNVLQTSIKSLRHFVNVYKENVSALKTLKVDVEKETNILVTLMLRKINSELLKRFEQSRNDSKVMPTAGELIEFLEGECNQLEATNIPANYQKTNTNVNKPLLTSITLQLTGPLCL